jgi:hypothetical protein
MDFAIATGIRILEVLFFAGWVGSLLVILLSLIDYIRTYLMKDESVSPPPPLIEEPESS